MNDLLLRYDISPDVLAFSTKRTGGLSSGSYAEFNCNYYCGDKEESVTGNRQILCSLLDIPTDRLVTPHQTHDTKIAIIDKDYIDASVEIRSKMLEGIDAMITNMRGLCIAVSTADCVPILLFDPSTGASAAIHAGWRGTLGKIVEKAIDTMKQEYQCKASNIKAVIGPSISLKSFEVGDEVYNAFSDAGFDMKQIAKKEAKWHIDLWKANAMQLESKGVLSQNINVAGICTYINQDTFFSARRLSINSGRILTGIVCK